MKKKKTEEMRLDPTERICPKFDETGIALFPTADFEEMGVVVQDECAEEHMM